MQIPYERDEARPDIRPTIAAAEMADAIMMLVDNNGGGTVSFVEVANEISGFIAEEGAPACELLWGETEDANIILWINVSVVGVASIKIALEQGDDPLVFLPTSPLVYFADGRVLQLPLAKSVRAYKKPHWLPVTLCRHSYVAKRRKSR